MFLIMSYISNNYIAGIGMNFIPLFLPVGKTFHPKPVLGTLFHSNTLPKNSDKFFKKMNLTVKGCRESATYYELLEMGGNFISILKGLTGLSSILNEGNKAEVSTTPIFLVNYDNQCWYQKLVLVFFGAIQLIIGIATTMFSSFAYLFSGKHGYLLNLPEEKRRLEKQQKFPFKDLGVSMLKSKTDQAEIKSGWTKFAVFFNFINFIFVDKLTYGTRYFIEDKHSSFMDRFKYFLLIVFVLIIIQSLKGAYSETAAGITGGIILIIILFVFFAKRILNPKFTPSPFANYEGFLNEIQIAAATNKSPNKNITFNDLEKDITNLKDTLNKAIKNYSNAAEKIARNLKFEKIPQKSFKEQLKEQMDRFKKAVSKAEKEDTETTKTTKTESTKTGTTTTETTTSSVENAAKYAQSLSPIGQLSNKLDAKALAGGSIKVKPQYKKIIQEIKNELSKN